MVKIIDNTDEQPKISIGTVLKYENKYYMIILVIEKEYDIYTLLDLNDGMTNARSFYTLESLVDYYKEAIFYNEKNIALCIDDY